MCSELNPTWCTVDGPLRIHFHLGTDWSELLSYSYSFTCHDDDKYLFAVCWSQSKVIQAVWCHISNPIEEPGICDGLHTQLPDQDINKTKNVNTNFLNNRKCSWAKSWFEWMTATIHLKDTLGQTHFIYETELTSMSAVVYLIYTCTLQFVLLILVY